LGCVHFSANCKSAPGEHYHLGPKPFAQLIQARLLLPG
jgi:hypothetical protein